MLKYVKTSPSCYSFKQLLTFNSFKHRNLSSYKSNFIKLGIESFIINVYKISNDKTYGNMDITLKIG